MQTTAQIPEYFDIHGVCLTMASAVALFPADFILTYGNE